MIKKVILLFACSFVLQKIRADTDLTTAQYAERLAMVTNLNHGSTSNLACRTAATEKILQEANYFAERLKLPMRRPILMTDIQDCHITPPWFCVISGTNRFPDTVFGIHIFDPDIPREQRLRALKIGVGGGIVTTNFEFEFTQGQLRYVMRLDGPETEYYARRLDELVGKPSLIDTNGAYQLATQWLAAVDIDVTVLEKSSGPLIKGGHSVNQLRYLPRGATNAVTLPLYYVDFGTQHFPASGNLKAFDEPLVSVEILGTTKELQELRIGANTINGSLPYAHRPLLLLTNALDLVRTPNPPMKQFENPAPSNSPIKRIRHRPNGQTNSTPPASVEEKE